MLIKTKVKKKFVIFFISLFWMNIGFANTAIKKKFNPSDLFKPEYVLKNYEKNILVKPYLFALGKVTLTISYFKELLKINSAIFCIPNKTQLSADDYFTIFKAEYFRFIETIGSLPSNIPTSAVLIFGLEHKFPCNK